MSAISGVLAIPALIFVINLPFGYWRAGLRKLSFPWFVAIHAPVLLGIGLRFLLGVPFRLATLPLFVAAFFTGQMIGGKFNPRPIPARPAALGEAEPQGEGGGTPR